MKFKYTLILILLVVVLGVGFFYSLRQANAPSLDAPSALSFEDCALFGYPVSESYPRQCHTPDGQVFSEDIGNELEKADRIRVASPRPNALIANPVTIQGEARGYWYFEASFPVTILDANGKTLLQSFAEAHGEWMTEDFDPFEKTFTYAYPETETGTIVLHRDNPSGLLENDDELRIPVYFKKREGKGNVQIE